METTQIETSEERMSENNTQSSIDEADNTNFVNSTENLVFSSPRSLNDDLIDEKDEDGLDVPIEDEDGLDVPIDEVEKISLMASDQDNKKPFQTEEMDVDMELSTMNDVPKDELDPTSNSNLEPDEDCNDASHDLKCEESPSEDRSLDETPVEEIKFEESMITDEMVTSELNSPKSFKPSESAFQRLASLGVIDAEEPVEESKENLLKKLASRGSISITPSGGKSLPIPSQSSLAAPSTKSKIRSKSAVSKQKAKKIKIDPGNSLDIDKDFDSLISVLSTGSTPHQEDQNKFEPEGIEQITNCTLTQRKLRPTNVIAPCSTATIESSVEQSNENEENTNVVDSIATNLESTSVLHPNNVKEMESDQSVIHSEDNEEKVSPPSSLNNNIIEEGSAEILVSTKRVFYNKVQEFNRDMSIAALTVFSEMHQQDPRTRYRGKKRKALDVNEFDSCNGSEDNIFVAGKKSENGITILDALSATGIRAIRYAREIPGVKQVIANDISEDAVESIKKNLVHNGVTDLVTTSKSDAAFLMYQRVSEQQFYDAVELDPFGCPAEFLDSAVKVVRDGGILLVTCTDMAVLVGKASETCHSKYGAVSLRTDAYHEMAIRIALQSIESHANRYGRYTVPLLSFHADYYIRVIVQVYTSPVTVKKTPSKLSMVYQCVGCHTFHLQPLGVLTPDKTGTQPKSSLPHAPPVNTNCFHCHHKHQMGGPIWTAPFYSSKFVESMLSVVEKGRFVTTKRMQGMLEVIREELPDVPLYYTVKDLCGRLHCQAIPLIDIKSALLNAGYRVSSSHTAPTSIKTNAPAKVIWDIMRCWVHMNPVNQKRIIPGSVLAAIIIEPPTLIANFDIHPNAEPSSSVRKLLRFQQNPQRNWGPGRRGTFNNSEDDPDEKRRLNQNKNKNKTASKKTVEIIEVVTIDDDEVSDSSTTAENSATM